MKRFFLNLRIKKPEGYKFEALSICRWSDDFEVVEKNAYFDLSEIETDEN